MRKSYNYEEIVYHFQIVLRNSLNQDSGVFWIRIDIFGWIRYYWIRIQNTDANVPEFA